MPAKCEEDINAIVAQLQSQGIDYVFGFLPDLHGEMKGKGCAVDRLPSIVRNGVAYQLDAIAGLGLVGPTEDDCTAHFDLSRVAILPWSPNHAVCPVRLRLHSQPYPFDLRAVLERQLERVAARGLTPMLGVEPEFYLLREHDHEPLFDDGAETASGVCHDMQATIAAAPFLETMARHMNQLGWGVSVIDHELSPGQYELTFDFADMLTMADRMTLFKAMARHVARQCGGIATFMPKPFNDRASSGLHLNVSLFDEGGSNLFEGQADGARGFSRLALQFTAGVLHHASALTAILCPTVNSYKRLVPHRRQTSQRIPSWSPVYIGYGFNVRTMMCRLPTNRFCLEVRPPDPTCNIHLASALILAAGIDGIERELEPGPPVLTDTNKFQERELAEQGLHRLPSTLDAALRAFKQSALVQQVLGQPLVDAIVALKEEEMDIFAQHVTEWERARYL